ncbi:MAG: T9SS type A sorting domain-containing protein [Opitutaceae bacterium]|nr:T9SS type A sorting domain-containing protein [Cytophagales bacterium]
MKRRLLLLFLPVSIYAQFEPQVSEIGTTAISAGSNIIVAWAKGGTAFPGYKNIANPGTGRTSVGTIESALGKAGTSGVLSLGDAGVAILTFERPIKNGIGADFAVFENGFREINTNKDYLEYAFVEVSSDGTNFYRFPAKYVGDSLNQISSYQTTDTKNYHNLAGKYWAGFGTPFNLEELSGISGLEIENITHVKIVDVVGTINPLYSSRDLKGRKINDPYPTDFASGGFDLDAVAVINQAEILGLNDQERISGFNIYPNPATNYISISETISGITSIQISNIQGNKLLEYSSDFQKMDISSLVSGIYVVEINQGNSKHIKRLTIK